MVSCLRYFTRKFTYSLPLALRMLLMMLFLLALPIMMMLQGRSIKSEKEKEKPTSYNKKMEKKAPSGAINHAWWSQCLSVRLSCKFEFIEWNCTNRLLVIDDSQTARKWKEEGRERRSCCSECIKGAYFKFSQVNISKLTYTQLGCLICVAESIDFACQTSRSRSPSPPWLLVLVL